MKEALFDLNWVVLKKPQGNYQPKVRPTEQWTDLPVSQ